MKQLIYLLIITIVLGISACDSNPSTTRATGVAYEVVVVMDQAAWEHPAGNALQEELKAPVPYLPQPESSMRVTYLRPDQFKGLYKYVRNILIVNINKDLYTKASLLKDADKWANGQAVLYFNAPDEQSIATFLEENPQAITDIYAKEEMKRTSQFLRNKYSTIVLDKVREKFGIFLYASSDIVKVKENEDCLWFSNDAVTGRSDILVYSFPYTDAKMFTLEYLVDKRDSIAKYMVPGSFDNTYMSTERRVVDYFSTQLNGKYCGVLRGLWRMEGGDMMGGPFVSYARLDEKNSRIIVTEGFVYEPRKEKKNYIRRLEAALQTMQFEYEPENRELTSAVSIKE